jgi:hypothetical protein
VFLLAGGQPWSSRRHCLVVIPQQHDPPQQLALSGLSRHEGGPRIATCEGSRTVIKPQITFLGVWPMALEAMPPEHRQDISSLLTNSRFESRCIDTAIDCHNVTKANR